MKRGQLESNLLVLVALALLAFGLVMVYSATSAAAAVSSGDSAYYLKRQALFALLGLGAMILCTRCSYHRLRAAAPGLILVSLVLLAAVLLLGQRVNGARRWVPIGPTVFQPSELAKLAFVAWAAAYLTRHRPQTLGELARPIGLLTGVFCLLLLAEPDLGTAIALLVTLGGMMIVAGAPMKVLVRGGAIATALALAAIWFEPYRRVRIFSFLNPWHDAKGAGYQTVEGMIGLGSGGLFGVGLGHGVQKIFYLPEAHTDMIFAIIGEELGLVGSAAVILAFLAFAYAGLKIALDCPDPFGKRLAAGLTVLICGQATINLAAVVGLAPLTGIPLPFVSYGGSSLVVALASVGILLNIARNGAVEAAAEVPDRGRRDSRTRAARTRGRRSAAGAWSDGELRRVAGSRRGSARS